MIAAGTAALDAGRWRDAAAAFEAALSASETPEALDGLAQALYWQGDYTVRSRTERLRRIPGLQRPGTRRDRGVLARLDYAAPRNAAAATAARAGKRLAAASGDCPERGWSSVCAAANRSADEKQRRDDRGRDYSGSMMPIWSSALAHAGFCLVIGGRVAEGMRQPTRRGRRQRW
jgi:hypothetical protein